MLFVSHPSELAALNSLQTFYFEFAFAFHGLKNEEINIIGVILFYYAHNVALCFSVSLASGSPRIRLCSPEISKNYASSAGYFSVREM